MNTFEKFKSTLEETIAKFSATTAINALKNGMLATLPLTMLGSIFLLIASFPISNWSEIMTGLLGTDWKYPFTQVASSTFDIIALVASFSIAYQYARLKAVEPFACGMISLVNFLILIPSVVTNEGVTVESVIPKNWAGGSGMATAIIVALVTGWLYTAILHKGWRIKMPPSVPEGVSNSFSALIPGFLTILLAFSVCAIFRLGFQTTLSEYIVTVLQIPLQTGLGSLTGYLLLTLFISLFWMFGIHASVLNSIANPFLRANGLANQALIDSGIALSTANGAYLVTYQSRSNFITMTGACITIGLVLAMVFRARSTRYKQLGKLALIPSLFNVNEPVMFGFPIVLNFSMLIPVFLVPILAALTVYFSAASGFMPPFGAIEVPWTTPPIISGFIIGGWRAAVVQIFIIIESFVIYYPFFKKQDELAFLEEKDDTEESVLHKELLVEEL